MSIAYLPFSVGTITIASGQKAVIATAAPGLGNNCLPGDTLQIGRDKSFTVGATGTISDAGFDLVEDFTGYINNAGAFVAGSIAVGVPYKLFKGPGWAETTRLNSNAMALMTAARNGFVVDSLSTLSIGAGEKSFGVSELAPVYAGAYVRAVSKANPTTHWMWGKVAAVTAGTVTLDVMLFAGAGSRSDWRIMLSSERGPMGAAASVPGATTIGHVPVWSAADGSALGAGFLVSAFAKTLLDDADGGAIKSTLGIGNVASFSITGLADGAVAVVPINATAIFAGVMIVTTNDAAAGRGMFWFRSAATGSGVMDIAQSGSNPIVPLMNTVLTGATGTVGRINLSAANSGTPGTVYVENRAGATRNVSILAFW